MNYDSRPDPHATRVSLLLRLHDGSTREVAAEELYRSYEGIVRGYAHRLGASVGEADGIAHDVLTDFLLQAQGFAYDKGKGGLRAYMFRITNNVLRKRWRTDARSQRLLAYAAEDDPVLARHWDFAWQANLLPRAREHLRRACDGDPATRRRYEVFERSAFERRTIDEIASEFGLQPNDVYKARSEMRAKLEEILRTLDPMDLAGP